MKKLILCIFPGISLLFASPAKSQDVYSISSWENLFQWAEVPSSPQNTQTISERLRYTLVLNFGQYWHLDLNNYMGFYSGLAIRNVGFIYDATDIPTKTIRRSYNLGVPLALKLGAFNKHFYLFGGGEYELLFHYKAKRWYTTDRKGRKTKDTEWFSDKTRRFVPAIFAGLQFPRGFNIKYKLYLENFINPDYVGYDLGMPGVNFANYKDVRMHYLSISWQLRTDRWRKYVRSEEVALHL